jgi:hypothetical protein
LNPGYTPVPTHVTKECPNLLQKWEEKKTHCNMVTTEPHRKNKKNDEVDVRVITYEGEKMGIDLKKGEISSQIP